MSKTPRTDGLVEQFRRERWFDVDEALELARQLERESAARFELLKMQADAAGAAARLAFLLGLVVGACGVALIAALRI